ncbi:hypothetical protein ACVNF4_24055 [Streptomyces sp. S6]
MIAETVCSAVAAAGLGIAAVTAYRKRFLSAARTAAYALVPLGLVMTGVVGWAADTAFSPTAWAGIAVLGGAWGLFTLTRAVERRRGGPRKDGKDRRETTRSTREAVAPAASTPTLGQTAPTSTRQSRPTAARRPEPATSTEDFSDIEAILKKHGI